MKKILTFEHEEVGKFVSERLSNEHLPWGQFSSLGLLEDDKLIAGVIYNHFSEANVCMHVAAVEGRRWLTPTFLFAAFDYPFNQMRVQRVTGLVPRKNLDAQRFDEHLGFRREGLMRKALPSGDDLIIYGMLRGECKWVSRNFCNRLVKRSTNSSPGQACLFA